MCNWTESLHQQTRLLKTLTADHNVYLVLIFVFFNLSKSHSQELKDVNSQSGNNTPPVLL